MADGDLEKHDHTTFHAGLVPDNQLASGTASLGDVPVSNGDGTRTWGAASGGGGMFGDIEGGSPTSIYGGTDPVDGGTP